MLLILLRLREGIRQRRDHALELRRRHLVPAKFGERRLVLFENSRLQTHQPVPLRAGFGEHVTTVEVIGDHNLGILDRGAEFSTVSRRESSNRCGFWAGAGIYLSRVYLEE